MTCYCHLYEDEPWALLAQQAGFEPCQTESRTRDAFRFAAAEIKQLCHEKNVLCDTIERLTAERWHFCEPMDGWVSLSTSSGVTSARTPCKLVAIFSGSPIAEISVVESVTLDADRSGYTYCRLHRDNGAVVLEQPISTNVVTGDTVTLEPSPEFLERVRQTREEKNDD